MDSIQGITAQRVLELIEGQKYRCALSGRKLTPNTASLDHKNPLAKGGEHSLGNLWVLHREINTAKGVLTPAEFIQLCREVVLWQGEGGKNMDNGEAKKVLHGVGNS